ncbi:MAG: hypothetical protein KFF73_15230 [Cyclobacteriaceae bacterium]|nr:hypothetical protein [Cyclobacteriaceae bacterium]
MNATQFSEKEVLDFNRDGYILVKSLFDQEETGLLKKSAAEDRELDKHSVGRNDGEGGTVRLSLWNHPGDDIDGMVAGCHRVVDRGETLL